MLSNRVIVFSKKKLVSVDSILPLLLELNQKCGTRVIIVVMEYAFTYQQIKKNVVISDAIDEMGELIMLGGASRYRIIRKIIGVSQLIKFAVYGFFGAKFIHFGGINNYPLGVLAKTNSGRIYRSEHQAFEQVFHEFDDRFFDRETDRSIKLLKNETAIALTDSFLNRCSKGESNEIYLYRSPRTRKVWFDHVRIKESYYYSKYHPSVEEDVIIYVLSYFGHIHSLSSETVMLELFKETVSTLHDYYPGKKILFKPHVFTDLEIVEETIKDVGCNGEITYLHPSVLALRASLFISNLYSTVQADAHSLGVTTIEYSSYSKKYMIASEGKSQGYPYIDFFINNDLGQLKSTLESLKKNPLKKPKLINANSKNQLLNVLSDNECA